MFKIILFAFAQKYKNKQNNESNDIHKITKQFVMNISDADIWNNYKKYSKYIGEGFKHSTQCGLTSRVIYCMLKDMIERKNIKYQKKNIYCASDKDGIIYHDSSMKTNKKLQDVNTIIENNSITKIDLSSSTSVTEKSFPGHAFIVMSDKNDKCVIFQSFVNYYDHKTHIDIVDRNIVTGWLKEFMNATMNRHITKKTIDALNKLTHLNCSDYVGYQFNELIINIDSIILSNDGWNSLAINIKEHNTELVWSDFFNNMITFL
jgi:hypothetical protein